MARICPAEGRSAAGEDPAKRRQILEGAKRVFVSTGFDAASMNDITRESGVSKSTLYVYFRSKEELFHALIAEEREAYFADIEELLVDAGRPDVTLRRFAQRLFDLMLSPEAMTAKRTVIAVASRMPELGREFYRRGPMRGLALVAEFIRRASELGTLKVEDHELAASQFIELATAGVLRRRFFDDQAPPLSASERDRIVDAAVRVFMAAYGPDRRD